jgi:hypothetical protein
MAAFREQQNATLDKYTSGEKSAQTVKEGVTASSQVHKTCHPIL